MAYLPPTKERVRLGGARVSLTAARAARADAKATLDPRRKPESALAIAEENVRRVHNRIDRGMGDSRFRRYVRALVGIGGGESVETLAAILWMADQQLAKRASETYVALTVDEWLAVVKNAA